MPKYSFALKNGKFLDLEGDTQPSDEEVESIAREQGVQLQLGEEKVDTTLPDYARPNASAPEVAAQPEAEKGWLRRAWDAANAPLTTIPSRIGKSIADYIDQPSVERNPLTAQIMGYLAGTTEGTGDVLSSLTSPANIAATLLTAGSASAARLGLPQVARLAGIGGRIASAPVAAHGAYETFRPDATLGERAMGVTEMAGGLAGMKQPIPSPLDNVDVPSLDIPETVIPEQVPVRASIADRINGALAEPQPDLMSQFLESQPQGPVRAGLPYTDLEGNVIGATTDTAGSTGIQFVDEAIPEQVIEPEIFEGKIPENDFERTQQWFIDDSARMQREATARAQDPVQRARDQASNDNWNRGQDELNIYEGTFRTEPGLNKPMIPYEQMTPEQKAVRDSYQAIKDESETYGRWFSEQEELLPEGEYFKPPPEIARERALRVEELRKAHKANIDTYKAGQRPSIIDIPPEDITVTEQTPLDYNSPEEQLMRMQRGGRKELSTELSPEKAFDMAAKAGDDIVIPAGQNTPKMVNEVRSKGYKFVGRDPQGNMRFVKTDKPVTPISAKAEPILRKMRDVPPEQAGPIREAWNLSRGAMSVDLPFITSAAFRQGLPLIGTKNWFKAWGPSIKSYGSKRFYDAHNELLKADPLMQRGQQPVNNAFGEPLLKNGRPIIKETPSVLEQAGVTLTDLKSLSSREESVRSQLAERIPVWGKVIGASNRAYTAYINDLRINTFRNFYEAMPDKNNLVALKQLGDAVNTFTGKGPLKSKIPFSSKEIDLEKYAGAASEVLFAPKLIASRLQMLNPVNYTMTQPQVRKEYLKSFARTAGAWMTMAGLANQAGAEVVLDPRSADFGKIKIGNFRLDPAGGFQQYLVLMSRLGTGEFTSSTSGRTFELGKGFGAQSRGTVLQDFIANKLHPSVKYFYDAVFAKEKKPFPMFDRAAQLFVPMMASDLIELAQEEPQLVPWMAPLVSAGMGGQYYEKGDELGKPVITPLIDQVLGTNIEGMDITLGR